MIRFGSDGWSAPIGEVFNEGRVRRVADAVAKLWTASHPGAEVLVGYDTRRQAREMAICAAETLAAAGFSVKLSRDVCPISMLAWSIAEREEACGGIMITASNAPADYLGIRIRRSDGSSCPQDEIRMLEALIELNPPEDKGSYEEIDLVGPYVEHIKTCIHVDVIRDAKLKVVHDPMYGASRGIVASILSDMGVEVHEVHGELDPDFGGIHPHIQEPWVDDCERAVLDLGASAGLINDGDADRAGLIDEHGSFISPQMLTTLVIQHLVKNRGLTGRVVINLAGSAMTRQLVRELGCDLTVTPIGFSRAGVEMLEGDVLLSSDGMGGLAIPHHFMERDGILIDLLMVEAMAMTGQTPAEMLNDLVERLGYRSYGSRDVHLDSAAVQSLRNMLPGICPAELSGKVPVMVNHMDGLRLQFDDDSWVLVRPSRAESLVRVYAEASTPDDCQALLEDGAAIARGELS
ncbi:MAG: phosphoglucomutase/phosphomannomutase family protein [Atopobiaceae bacterium]|nr:phosphoglucomutase/phosphomannomutase family protein [Atopobiaceae bacterium]